MHLLGRYVLELMNKVKRIDDIIFSVVSQVVLLWLRLSLDSTDIIRTFIYMTQNTISITIGH